LPRRILGWELEETRSKGRLKERGTDGWMDEVRRSSVTIHGLIEEYTGDRIMWGN